MKILLSLLFVCLTFGGWSQALPIENANFETWGFYNTWTLDPEAWGSGNFQLATHVFPYSSAYEGEVAMQVYPYTFFEPLPGVVWQQIETTFIPATFSFAVKCHIDGLDSVFVRLNFMNNFNPVYTKVWSSDESIDDWEMVTLELDQIEPIMDLVSIEVVAGYGTMFLEGSPNTWISVDAVGFEQDNSVEERRCSPTLFPNPTNGSLQIRLCNPGEQVRQCRLFNHLGQLIETRQNVSSLDFSSYSKGIYLLEILDSNGAISRQQIIHE